MLILSIFFTQCTAQRSKRMALILQRVCLGILLVVFIHFALPTAALGSSPIALVSRKVQVPSNMASAPFDVERSLNVPHDFQIAVYARIENARFMAIAPNGDLLVSQPSTGKVLLVQPSDSGDPLITDFVTDLHQPHGLVFHAIEDTTYLGSSQKTEKIVR